MELAGCRFPSVALPLYIFPAVRTMCIVTLEFDLISYTNSVRLDKSRCVNRSSLHFEVRNILRRDALM
jgi:hypothetical protein